MFNSSFDLSSLNGTNGFAINGVSAGDRAGFAVSNAGDVNNDGIADLIIGAPSTIPNGTTGAGKSYIVFGGSNLGSTGSFNLSSLNGTNGFVLSEIVSGDSNEISVSNAGDINGDGIDDLMIGASTADPNAQSAAGETYVVFGGTGIGSSGSFNLATLNGTNGFTINGVNAGDRSGRSVSNAGDINGDGRADLLIGAPAADPNGSSSGASYVVFGGTGIGSLGELNLSSLNGTNGFAINGGTAGDFQGFSVSKAGDVNNDGKDDLIVGASTADPNGSSSGATYVIFGGVHAGDTGSINPSNLNGTNGFVLNGVTTGDLSGRAVSNAGDINGDGIADLIIGAPAADPNGTNSGASYVVFGQTNLGSSGTFNLSGLNGSNGFVINGIVGGDSSGRSVSSAGDLNGDGLGDLIIGASRAETSSSGGAGDSYVVFGGTGIGSSGSLNLSSLNGSNGFVINGIDLTTGYSVSNAGDVNQDGTSDIVIGAYNATANGNLAAGQSYVIFGSPTTAPCNPTAGNDNLTGCATDGNDTVDGLAGNDTLAGGNGNDSLKGGNGNDTVDGGTGNDTLIGGNDLGADLLNGNDGLDILQGGNGNDTLDGGKDSDRLTGGGNNDRLTGGLGRDTLNGGAGADQFVIASGTTSNLDLIADFANGVDLLDLTGNLTFGSLTISDVGVNTTLIETSTNETLAILRNIDAVEIDAADFI